MERSDFSRSASPALWGSLLALAILAAAVRLPFAGEPPGRDQGLFMTEAHLLATGGRLYADVWEHKQPGIVALYAVAMRLFGDDYAAIQLLNAMAGFTTAVLLLLLFRRVGCSALAGFSGGALYLLLYGGPIFGGFWATAQVEIFLDPCVAAALLWLMPRASSIAPTVSPPSRAELFAAGVALGSAVFWLKYSCAPLAGLALLASWSSGRSAGSPTSSASRAPATARERMACVAAVAVGMSITPLLMLLYFAWGGRVVEFWDATVAFNITHSRVSAFHADRPARWIALLLIRPAELAVLYIFAALALLGRFSERRDPLARGARFAGGRAARDRLLVAGSVLWVLALAQVFLQGKFWVYHYHVVLLPLSISASLGMEWFSDRLAERIGKRLAWSLTAAIALAFLWPHGSLVREYVDVHRITEHWRAELSREEFLATYRWLGGDYDAAENRAVAARVVDTTQPGDAIFVWGFEPSIYFHSGRAPASRFLYDYPLMPELGTVHGRHVEWLMDDLEASAPALFLVVQRDTNDLESRDSAAQLRALPPLRAYLARYYRPVWRQGDFSAFRRQPLSRARPD